MDVLHGRQVHAELAVLLEGLLDEAEFGEELRHLLEGNE